MLQYEILTINQKIGQQVFSIHPVIIKNDTELVLYDAGCPNQIDQIDSELQKHGFCIQDITKIVISHQDHDHIGSLKVLKDLNRNAEIISSPIEAPYINGNKISLRLLQAEEYNKTLSGKNLEFGIQFVNYLKTIQDCVVDKFVNDGEYIIQGMKVVTTPGHTPGHISLFLEEEEVFVAGDALAVENKELVIANPEFTLDLETCKKSIEKIKNLAPKKIICYHGGSIENNIDALLENVIAD